MGKVIFHIDLNAFFANAEIMRNCALENQPLVVAGMSKRAVVCTASYAAREYGVHSAMPIAQALQLCPDLIVVPCDFEWYEQCSARFFDYIRRFSPYVEPASIDECYVDVTDVIAKYKRPLDLAWQIQSGLQKELGLTCSIGVAPNRFLAKMASDMKKPMGITILRINEVAKKLWPLPISEMQGIGSKTAPILMKNGIMTIGDLANPENEELIKRLLGRQALPRIQNARGYGSNQLNFNTSVKSLSQSTTLEKDIDEEEEARSVLRKLAISLSRKAQVERVSGKHISVSIRYSDFSTIVRSLTLSKPTDNDVEIYECAALLFDKNYQSDQPIRHLGIALGSLYSAAKKIEQLSFFQTAVPENQSVLDALNEQLSDGKLMFASELLKKKQEH